MRPLLLIPALIVFALPLAAQAQPAPEQPAASQAADAGLEARTALATQMADLTPPRQTAEMAIEAIVSRAPQAERQELKSKMLSAFDFEALRQAFIRNMAGTFTEAELRKMVEYHSSPEAKAIAEKMPAYEAKLKPEITKMLDVALMVARTGKPGEAGSTPPGSASP